MNLLDPYEDATVDIAAMTAFPHVFMRGWLRHSSWSGVVFWTFFQFSHYCITLAAAAPTVGSDGQPVHLGESRGGDPQRNITCVGTTPDLQLPIFENGFDPNQATMQELCAKPQYGGGLPGQHAGGYCFDRPQYLPIGEVAFDTGPSAHTSAILQNPRFMLACLYRCFCNYGLPAATAAHDDTSPVQQPRSDWPLYPRLIEESHNTYELQLDINNDFTTSRFSKVGKQGKASVLSLVIYNVEESNYTRYWNGGERTTLSLDPGNSIQCRGDLPSFVIPSPYTTADFTSLQKLCATQLNGGRG